MGKLAANRIQVQRFEVERAFTQALRQRGLELNGPLHADGQIHRCDVSAKPGHSGRNDGSYKLHLDGAIPHGGFQNSTPVAHPVLLWLGDVIPVPGPLPNTLSVGDCLILLGTLILLHKTCGRRSRTSGTAAAPAVSPATN